MFTIHPSAKENFDKKAISLLDEIKEYPRDIPQRDSKVSDERVVDSLDVIEINAECDVDYKNTVTARYFEFKHIRYGIAGSSYELLVNLSEAILKNREISEKLSKEFVEECIFEWIINYHIENIKNYYFTDFFIRKSFDSIKDHTILVPIANTIVEVPFQFCGFMIRPLTKSMMDEITKIDEDISSQEKRYLQEYTEELKRNLQGFAVIEMQLTCERKYASELAFNIADKITSLLSIYSHALIIPDLKSTSKVKGTEHLLKYSMILWTKDESPSEYSRLIDTPTACEWRIDQVQLDDFKKCGFEIISEIASKKSLSDFEATILNMSLIYSKAAFTADPIEKLVYILSALESTLLRNDNESIQQNIAERLAIFIKKGLPERKQLINNFKNAYQIRSKYLHRGQTSQEISELTIFFKNVWIFFVLLLGQYKNFNSKLDFLNALDDKKLS